MGIYRMDAAFEDRFKTRFGDRLRLRWSDQWNEWQLEQKVRRGVAGSPYTEDRYQDDVIRYRDGYVWVMSFKQGTRFPCPKCGLTLKAPTRSTEMVSCQHCHLKGNDHHWMASYWPMDDTLIEYIEKMQKEVESRSRQLYDAEAALQKQQYRSVLNPTLDGFQDQFNKLAGIQSVGYTGKEFRGEGS